MLQSINRVLIGSILLALLYSCSPKEEGLYEYVLCDDTTVNKKVLSITKTSRDKSSELKISICIDKDKKFYFSKIENIELKEAEPDEQIMRLYEKQQSDKSDDIKLLKPEKSAFVVFTLDDSIYPEFQIWRRINKNKSVATVLNEELVLIYTFIVTEKTDKIVSIPFGSNLTLAKEVYRKLTFIHKNGSKNSIQ